MTDYGFPHREEPAFAPASPEGPTAAYASWGRRLAAYLIDNLLIALPAIAIGAFSGVMAYLDERDNPGTDSLWWIGIIAAIAISVIAPFIYYTVMLGSEAGQTFGKRWLGIRVRKERTGGPIGYGSAFLRYLIQFLGWTCLFPITILDYLWPLWDDKKQTIHDKAAGSIVVRD